MNYFLRVNQSGKGVCSCGKKAFLEIIDKHDTICGYTCTECAPTDLLNGFVLELVAEDRKMYAWEPDIYFKIDDHIMCLNHALRYLALNKTSKISPVEADFCQFCAIEIVKWEWSNTFSLYERYGISPEMHKNMMEIDISKLKVKLEVLNETQMSSLRQ